MSAPQPSEKLQNAPLSPGATIGILGGGQLGRMLAMAAAELGLRAYIFCPDPNCPASDVASAISASHYDDNDALQEFARAVDVVTYEFENVPVGAVETLERAGVCVRPGAGALENAQDRIVEKEFINSLGIATAKFHAVDCLADLEIGLAKIGRPAILKTRRLGYDGKGQTRITDKDIDLHGAFEKATAFAWAEVGAAPSILEGFVPFTCEISVIAARGTDGDIKLFDAPENTHQSGILKTSAVPAKISEATLSDAHKATRKILDALNYVGVIGVEFFVLADGNLIVNEIAPRVHNSGHWTSDACAVSQFEQHIRAVAGWPLGDPVRHSNAVMENLIGEDASDWRSITGETNACLHLYGKNEIRPGRKMGHVTRLSSRTG